jgi:ribosomal subunit interface protein
MEIKIKATNIELTPEIKNFIEREISDLEKILEKFKEEIKFFVEIGKPIKHHKKGDIFYAEIQSNLPAKTLRASSYSSNIREAIKEVKEKIERQIEKYKNK